jgi:hypothetical protein
MTQAATLAQLASSGALYADTSGNVGIGTTSPNFNSVTGTVCHINNSTAGAWAINHYTNGTTGSAASDGLIVGNIAGDAYVFNYESSPLIFGAAATERMRIDSGGSVLIGTTDININSGVGFKFNPIANTSGFVINSTTGTSSHIHLYNTNATNNGYRYYVVSNGGIYNYSGNNSNLSDERTKTNIELSGSYLSKICSIPVKLFNYKDEPENEQKTLGVVAQDVEKIAPELVNNVGFGDVVEGEDALKSIYTTDMMFALMKCIQELKAELDVCKAEIAALKGV